MQTELKKNDRFIARVRHNRWGCMSDKNHIHGGSPFVALEVKQDRIEAVADNGLDCTLLVKHWEFEIIPNGDGK